MGRQIGMTGELRLKCRGKILIKILLPSVDTI